MLRKSPLLHQPVPHKLHKCLSCHNQRKAIEQLRNSSQNNHPKRGEFIKKLVAPTFEVCQESTLRSFCQVMKPQMEYPMVSLINQTRRKSAKP